MLERGQVVAMDLPVALTRGEYLAHYSAGHSTIEPVTVLTVEELKL